MQQAVEALERSVHETIQARWHNSWPDYAAPSHTLNLVHGPSGNPVFIATVMAHVQFWKHGG
ncbi:hypothetical protein C884_00329 [Kocuria palustris PEL]|uniref:Uncharacterized protein n=2 Tax=Kocuria palustris TaxID=71999 RepID=M2YDC8_9MICC|nr:hypothetical protein C884_00329 [Kocuria palustris PEL]